MVRLLYRNEESPRNRFNIVSSLWANQWSSLKVQSGAGFKWKGPLPALGPWSGV